MPDDRKTRMTLTIDKRLKHDVGLLAAEQRRDISDQICFMLERALGAGEPVRRPQKSDD